MERITLGLGCRGDLRLLANLLALKINLRTVRLEILERFHSDGAFNELRRVMQRQKQVQFHLKLPNNIPVSKLSETEEFLKSVDLKSVKIDTHQRCAYQLLRSCSRSQKVDLFAPFDDFKPHFDTDIVFPNVEKLSLWNSNCDDRWTLNSVFRMFPSLIQLEIYGMRGLLMETVPCVGSCRMLAFRLDRSLSTTIECLKYVLRSVTRLSIGFDKTTYGRLFKLLAESRISHLEITAAHDASSEVELSAFIDMIRNCDDLESLSVFGLKFDLERISSLFKGNSKIRKCYIRGLEIDKDKIVATRLFKDALPNHLRNERISVEGNVGMMNRGIYYRFFE
ncbi:hypothetical protein HDE_00899 [Halotydeus destructor]|nr:hypothetical protein HDE_00899 [Halotydeus destructor]